MNKRLRLEARVNEAILETTKQIAESLGYNLSEYVRATILERNRKEREFFEKANSQTNTEKNI